MDKGIKNKESWDKWVKNNTDGYGGACVEAARYIMASMVEQTPPIPFGKGFASAYVSLADNDLDLGLTGFMAGAIASMVSQCGEHGELFKKDWNNDYGVEDAEGVVNPAILTVKDK